MRRKILLFSVLLAIVAIIVTSVLITVASYHDFSVAIKHEIIAEASYIGAGYELAGIDYLEGLQHPKWHRLTLIANDGTVIHDSSGNSALMDNHRDRPEVRDALQNGVGESNRFSNTMREQTYYYAILLKDGSVLRMSSTTSSSLTSYDRIFWIVALIVLLVFAVSVVIASFVTRRIVRPINTIDLEHPERNVVYDEIVPLLNRIKEQHNQIESYIVELKRSRREFVAITENMNEGFLVLGRSGNILSYNKSAISILSSQISASSGANILTLSNDEAFRNAVQSALEGKTEERVVDLDNRRCQLFANPVVENGSVQGVILLLMDITENQERDKLRREFTANVSHELKTPLTVISGYAELMANSVAKPQDIPKFSHKIYREAGRMIALVNDLMFLSGLEENVAPAREPVNLLELSDEVIHRLAPKASERNITLSASGDSAEIQGIPYVLEEVIYNLLDNAIKYNREGGSAAITVKTDGSTATLSVSDTGSGIPKSEHERIFERFYRVDKSRNRAIPGTGLGLSIVKHGAALHDAKVEIKSDEGAGTCVIMRFPVK